MNPNRISIVIPSIGGISNISRLLTSIYAQNTEAIDFEILLVINGLKSEAELSEINRLVATFDSRLKVFFLEKKGVNRARNYGLAQAQSEVILFLDDDCELSVKNYLKLHLVYHAQKAEVFATGGGYILPHDSHYFDEIYNSLQMKWLLAGRIGNLAQAKTQHLVGGNFSLKVSLAQAKDLTFDESIVYGGSEYEFFKRAYIEGLILEKNELEVVHHTHETLSSLSRKIFKQGRGKAHIDAKYPRAEVEKSPALKDKWQNEMAYLYFNYVFWLGYYDYQNKKIKIIAHLLKDIFNALNSYRYSFLNRISDGISSKKNKGDRF